MFLTLVWKIFLILALVDRSSPLHLVFCSGLQLLYQKIDAGVRMGKSVRED